MSDSRVRAFLKEMERFAENPIPGGVMSIPVRDVAENLRRAVDAPDTPQIIRTVEELESLGAETVVQRLPQYPGWYSRPETAGDLAYVVQRWGTSKHLPAVVLAPEDQVRAARKALEEA